VSDILEDLKNDHSDFDAGKLEDVFGLEPFQLFNEWLKNAIDKQQPEPNAFALSTVNDNWQTSARILYLKEMLDEKFVFYTNYESTKGKNLTTQSKASMLFFWPGLQQQIRIEGSCSKVSDQLSNEYFASRPRASQIGAWASHQSQKLESRLDLENRVKDIDAQFPNEVPRPAHWGGYALEPTKIEFWQGRPSRLHDRIVFEKIDDEWKIYRLNP